MHQHLKAVVTESGPFKGKIIYTTKNPSFRSMTAAQFTKAVKKVSCWTFEVMAMDEKENESTYPLTIRVPLAHLPELKKRFAAIVDEYSQKKI